MARVCYRSVINKLNNRTLLLVADKTLQVNASRVIISRGLATPEGIAVDWIADRIYFVDADLDHIEVADLDGRDRSVLIAGDVDSPRAIAVDPRFGSVGSDTQ